MKKNNKRKELKFLSLVTVILFFYGCSEENKSESSQISETEDLLLSYDLSVEEKSLKHPIILPGAPGEDSKLIDPVSASNIAITTYVDADVNFLVRESKRRDIELELRLENLMLFLEGTNEPSKSESKNLDHGLNQQAILDEAASPKQHSSFK